MCEKIQEGGKRSPKSGEANPKECTESMTGCEFLKVCGSMIRRGVNESTGLKQQVVKQRTGEKSELISAADVHYCNQQGAGR